VLTKKPNEKAQSLAKGLVHSSSVLCYHSGLKVIGKDLVEAVGVMVKKADKEAAP
jgi:hypothetical protein